MEVFIFKCNNKTQSECLRKSLFGSRESWANEVSADSVCLLYNFQSEIVYGVWRATGTKGLLDENAFDGRFPNQVRVQLDVEERGIKQASRNQIESFTKRKFSSKSPIKVELEEMDLLKLFKVDAAIELKRNSFAADFEEDFRQKYPREYHCDDGHDVRSQGETLIDNWLFKNNICHGYEVMMDIPERIYSDFTVYDFDRRLVYIEYWGKEGDEKYMERKSKKQEIYSKYKLNLVEIYPHDLKNFDHVMRAKLRVAKVIK
jgi:hypothetical protein